MKDYKNAMFIAFALASLLAVGMARRINKDAAVGLVKKDAAAEKAFKEANAAEDSRAAPAMTVTEEEKAAKEASAAEDSNAAPAMTVAEAEEAEAEAAAESEAAAETEAAAESDAAPEAEAAVESSVTASSISGPSAAQPPGDGSQGLPSKIFQEPVSKVAVAAAIEEPVSKVAVAAAIGQRASALQEDPEEATPSFDQQHFPAAGSSASSFLENSGVQGPPWRKLLMASVFGGAALGTSGFDWKSPNGSRLLTQISKSPNNRRLLMTEGQEEYLRFRHDWIVRMNRGLSEASTAEASVDHKEADLNSDVTLTCKEINDQLLGIHGELSTAYNEDLGESPTKLTEILESLRLLVQQLASLETELDGGRCPLIPLAEIHVLKALVQQDIEQEEMKQ